MSEAKKTVPTIYKYSHGWNPKKTLDKKKPRIDDNNRTQNIFVYIDNFLNSNNRRVKFGKPNKFVLVFSGTPGTGKSDTIDAIAWKYKRSVYRITGSETNFDFSEDLDDIYDSIIVIEDMTKGLFSSMADNGNEEQSKKHSNNHGRAERKITELQTYLDESDNGNIIIITTNDFQGLTDISHDALLRDGRVNKHVTFTYPSKQWVKDVFEWYCPDEITAYNNFIANFPTITFAHSSLNDYLYHNPNESVDDMVKGLISYLKEKEKENKKNKEALAIEETDSDEENQKPHANEKNVFRRRKHNNFN